MKTRLPLTLALAICPTMAFAKVAPSVAVVAGTANHIFKVIYKSKTANKVQVTIFNTANEMVFTESLNNIMAFTRPYNFSSLPEGEYTIVVRDSFGKKVEKVNFIHGTIESLISVRKLSASTSKYMLTSVNKGVNVLTISIYNEEGALLHNETRMVDGNFGIVYNLGEEGKYTFVVSDKTGVSKTINN